METKQVILLAAGAALLIMPFVMPVLRYLGRLLTASKAINVKSAVYVGGGVLLAAAAFLAPIDTPPQGPEVEPTPVDLSGPFYAGVIYRLSEERPVGVWEYISLRDKVLVEVRTRTDYRFLPADEFFIELMKYLQLHWEQLKSEDVSNHMKMLSMQFYQKGSGNDAMDNAWQEGYDLASAALDGTLPDPEPEPEPLPEPSPDGHVCPDCKGTGKSGDGLGVCLNCDGTGRVDIQPKPEHVRKVLFFYYTKGKLSNRYLSKIRSGMSCKVGCDADCDVILLDCREYRDEARQFGFELWPSFVLLEDGKVVEKWTGIHKPVSYLNDFLGG